MTQAPGITRKLTTILAADAANYSGRMAADEVGTVQALRKSRAVFEAGITTRGGRIANTAGDGLIAEFPSVVEATAAAIAIQRQLVQSPDLLPYRIGLHLGDVIVDGEDLLGDGVNLAARLQEAAPEGGIFASAQVIDHAKGRLQAEFRPLGPTSLKNLGNGISVFAVIAEGITAPSDLREVAPRVPDGSDLDHIPLSRDALPAAPEHEAFKRSRKRFGITAAILIAVDIYNGAGPSWPALAILAMGVSLFFKWRKLPPKTG